MRANEDQAETSVDDQLGSLQRLLGLAMVMTGSGDERRIIDLAATSVPTLGRSRLDGVYLADAGWRATAGPCLRAAVRGDVESQFAVLSRAGGALAILGERWGWAYPLRNLEGNFGFLVVGADDEPPATEQSMLRVLAQQSGIALANARLHERERASAAQLLEANTALASTVAALERSTAVHERLNRVAVAGEGQEGIARAVHEMTGHPVAVEDRYGNLRAWAGPDRPDPYPKVPVEERERMLTRALGADAPTRHGARLVATAHTGREILGLLALVDPRAEAGELENVALEHGATVLAVELAHLQILAETETRLGRDLAEELLIGTDDESALMRAQAVGYDLQHPHRVVAVEPRGDTPDDAFFHAVRRVARDLGVGSLLVSRRGAVVVLADPDRSWEDLRLLVEDQSGTACRVGVGGVCARPIDFPRSYREALLALNMQDASSGADTATTFDDLGIYQILAEVADSRGVRGYVQRWLGALLDYDAANRADLVLTLSRYLDCGRRYEATAQALNVHRSTLKYRLRRIREISGLDLTDPDSQFNLQVATRAWQTQLALRTPSSHDRE